MLQRIFGVTPEGEDAPTAVVELADDPSDSDLQSTLRIHIRKALAADSSLAADIRRMLEEADRASGVRVEIGTQAVGVAQSVGIVIGPNSTVEKAVHIENVEQDVNF
ncbi:hypothetical protein [Streptosporangium sp. NPDC049046]|uniref:hypothetical protein n=1 Tax=unclassified Streptosporangium TaxID=2632669 RepID=UPI003428D317